MSHPMGIKAVEEKIETTLHNLSSPKRSHAFWGFWLVVLVAFGLLWLRHGEWLHDPNAFMFGESPDGFKNYMTTCWHVCHDSSYVHYGGMNYPYGEHVLFTDNQPIFSAAMQWWNWHVEDIAGRTVGIVNMIQFLSLLFGAGVLFLLLHRLHLPVWYAGLAALGILFLSPQYIRFDGHFGLSHTWVFPLLLLLLYRYEVRHSRRYQSLQIGILVWFAAQLHFYYLGLYALFLGLYTVFQLINDPTLRNLRVRISHLVVMVLLPFLLLNIWIHWTNYATDRPANPYGFTTYIGYWEGIILPYEQFPLYQWLDRNIIQIRRVDFETQAYIGLVAVGFFLWIIRRRFRLFDPAWDEMAHHRVQKRYLYGIFTASLLLLLFSCGFPFAIKGMDWMVRFFGPLRQFRGLGRFTWAFYYTINVLAFYVLWHKSLYFKGFQGARFPWFRWVILLGPLVLLGYEAGVFQKNKKLTLRENLAKREVFAKDPNHWLNKVDFSQFQALLPLPYYHVGSENIWLDFDFRHYTKVQATALHTGVPDMGVNMSRTPVGDMVKSVQLISIPGQIPAILADLPNNRPIALMIEPGRWEDVQQRYRHLIAHATPVYDGPDLRILSLSPDSIRLAVREATQAIEQEMARKSAIASGPWRSERPPGWLLMQSYDSLTTSPHIFQGKGAYSGMMSDTTWLWKGRIPKDPYYLSMWVYVKDDMGIMHEVKIIENDRDDGHGIHFQHEGLRFYLRQIVNGWALFDLRFEIYSNNSTTSIFMQKKGMEVPFCVDEVLIKRDDVTLY
ncbi:MAG: YfhO family protein, partial [Saprospiraceae bacterium]|nr:YfhO family protein [Saprospiraceae bacterium]